MKIAYIAETSLTNKSAYTHHVLKMCDSFSKKGDVKLIIPFVDKKLNFEVIKKKFLLKSKKNFLIKSILKKKINNFLLRILFGYKTANHLKKNNSDLIITRSLISSFFLSIYEIRHFLEIHTELKGITKLLLIYLNYINSEFIIKVILISKSLSKKFPKLNKKKIIILHDAIDLKDFKYKRKRNIIRCVSYVGSFHKGKGIELILKLANEFDKIQFNIYGDPLGKIYKRSKNVKFFGHIDYNKVPLALSNSDILILPSADQQFGRAKNLNISNYNSPLKMFDYLASGKVILSSRRDGICEILKHKYNAVIVNKYELKFWVHALRRIILKKYNLVKLRKNSLKTAKKYTWDKRVESIVNSNF